MRSRKARARTCHCPRFFAPAFPSPFTGEDVRERSERPGEGPREPAPRRPTSPPRPSPAALRAASSPARGEGFRACARRSSRDLPGGAVLGVFQHHAHFGEFVADAVGFFEIPCLHERHCDQQSAAQLDAFDSSSLHRMNLCCIVAIASISTPRPSCRKDSILICCRSGGLLAIAALAASHTIGQSTSVSYLLNAGICTQSLSCRVNPRKCTVHQNFGFSFTPPSCALVNMHGECAIAFGVLRSSISASKSDGDWFFLSVRLDMIAAFELFNKVRPNQQSSCSASHRRSQSNRLAADNGSAASEVE